MGFDIEKNIESENKKIKQAQKEHERELEERYREIDRQVRAERRQEFIDDTIEFFEKVDNALFGPIRKKIDEAKAKRAEKLQKKLEYEQFENNARETYNKFISLCEQTKNNSGIETSQTELGNAQIIYTKNLGPIITIPTSLPNVLSKEKNDDAFTYEGFAPNEDGLLEYFNITIIKVGYRKRFEEVPGFHSSSLFFSGFSVNPKTKKVTPINHTSYTHKHRILEYIESQKAQTLSQTSQKEPQ